MINWCIHKRMNDGLLVSPKEVVKVNLQKSKQVSTTGSVNSVCWKHVLPDQLVHKHAYAGWGDM